jgi:hypothetical protein
LELELNRALPARRSPPEGSADPSAEPVRVSAAEWVPLLLPGSLEWVLVRSAAWGQEPSGPAVAGPAMVPAAPGCAGVRQ